MRKEQLGASEVPSFPIMGRATLPQHSIDIDPNVSINAREQRFRNSTKRRSCSFDDLLPVPNIFLRPRYRKDTETFERLYRQENSSTCAGRVNRLENRNRSHHVRSHTYDGTVNNNMFDSLPARINSPAPNTPNFATSYLGHAQQSTSQFSPLGNCSIESPRVAQSLARPIPRHSALNSTPVSTSTTTNGVGTISSSSTSAFETASSTFAKSRTSSTRTYSPSDGIDGDVLPFSEVRVMGNRHIQSHPYDELMNDSLYDSPNSNGSDRCIENLTSLSLISSEKASRVETQSCSKSCLKSP